MTCNCCLDTFGGRPRLLALFYVPDFLEGISPKQLLIARTAQPKTIKLITTISYYCPYTLACTQTPRMLAAKLKRPCKHARPRNFPLSAYLQATPPAVCFISAVPNGIELWCLHTPCQRSNPGAQSVGSLWFSVRAD